MQGHFRNLPVRMFQLGDDLFCITSPFSFVRPSGSELTVPVIVRDGKRLGFVTDGGSKPRVFAWLIGSHTDEAFPAYVLHDSLYRLQPYGHCERGRAICDTILLEAMTAARVGRIKRATIYRFVRLFGGLWFAARSPVDLSKITTQHTGPDFRLIPDEPSLTSMRIHMLGIPKDKSVTTKHPQTHNSTET